MLDAIRQFFGRQIYNEADSSKRSIEESLQIAAAALLVEVMEADDMAGKSERKMITGLLCEGFKLSGSQAEELVSLAEQEIDQAADYYQFTSLIKNFEMSQKENRKTIGK